MLVISMKYGKLWPSKYSVLLPKHEKKQKHKNTSIIRRVSTGGTSPFLLYITHWALMSQTI